MKNEQKERMRIGMGFIAALDQSGGSTPKALAIYGISKDQYSSEKEMFDLVHAMRTRIVTSPAFTSEHILGAILFEQTMDREVEGLLTGDYLWEKKGIVPFLKVDKGLLDLEDGVQLMKPIPGLIETLARANECHMFGTKMRSVIKQASPTGIAKIVDQQFSFAKTILMAGLVPIIEPEIDIHSPDKRESEKILISEILKNLNQLAEDQVVMLKLTIPDEADFYVPLINHPRVLRVVALSGGYSREVANQLLAQNHGLIASFSRALSEGLNVDQSDEDFNQILQASISEIYAASIT